MNITKYKIKGKIGDDVNIISGKYKGQRGKIKKVLLKKNYLVIENINLKTKHIKPKQAENKGEVIQIEGPIHYSNIRLISK
uniref:Large ribosomal subunit protein uL24c n=1 Tax=Sonderella linearis TaxID=110477 RepID=A0A1Z1MMK8_9FLOR|nr:ribosomal protein L24 [Sonderella linearis]ARW67082.1 ribosomal protein L24 [Sonderella linearis]